MNTDVKIGNGSVKILDDRKGQVIQKGSSNEDIACGRKSAAGSVSQRACVFCGSRVVLYPIADAVHLVHGPVGCAAYTWDIRGALSSGPQLHRMCFCTDLHEQEIIHGGEKKLKSAVNALIDKYSPEAVFVYATCIVGIIGDDIDAVCRTVEKERKVPVVPVHSEGFKGTKKDGYRAACDALLSIIGRKAVSRRSPAINILGDFNIAGETWVIGKYFKKMGINVISTMTGDGRVGQIMQAHSAELNIVQCSGSMIHLAKKMMDLYGIPFIRVSFSGIEDTAKALYDTADFFNNAEIKKRTRDLVKSEIEMILPRLEYYKSKCAGKKAAIYVGGAFKAISLVKALRLLGIKTVLAGTQTGDSDDYAALKSVCDDGTIIVDDSNPVELSKFLLDKKVDLFIGGVKERPMAYKLGIGFCDHNHERKEILAGFEGMVNFSREVYRTVSSPVWSLMPHNNRGDLR